MLTDIISFVFFKMRFSFYTKKMIERYQLKKAKEIVRYSIKHSKFFNEYYKNSNVTHFFSIPTVNKKIMMDNLTDYNTLGFNKEDLVNFALEVEKTRDFSRRFKGVNVAMSSGTSGNKGIIITTKKEEDYVKAMYLSRLVLPKFEKLNCAFILRVSSPAFNYNKFGNRLTYISQLQPMDEIIRQLENIKPNVISAPPSMLKLFAIEVQNKRLNIHPKLIYSYAEVLYDDVKDLLVKVFKCPIHQIYQGSEGFYALTCRHGNLHINEDMVLLELYDRYGNPLADGHPSYRMLVTDLNKKAQPIIRYEVNDILTIRKSNCKCGSKFRIIENIQGRSDDMFWGIRTDNKKPHFIFQDYIARAIISTSEDIEEYQAIQESYTKIVLRILLKKNSNAKIIKIQLISAIRDVFSKYGCVLPNVTVLFGKPILNKQSNKLIRIKCNIKKGV